LLRHVSTCSTDLSVITTESQETRPETITYQDVKTTEDPLLPFLVIPRSVQRLLLLLSSRLPARMITVNFVASITTTRKSVISVSLTSPKPLTEVKMTELVGSTISQQPKRRELSAEDSHAFVSKDLMPKTVITEKTLLRMVGFATEQMKSLSS